MKKILSVLVLILVFVATASAQLFKQDPNVKVGKLKNGLTYYIRHNAEPKGLANFYIAQKVGAIQENPDQRGLAHFLEHMAFNGSKHFPGTSLRTYLESIGVQFGGDLNAYTSVEETVYNIDNVPVAKSGAIDSCLLILHDWSHDLTLSDEEIENERGVIHEEWRSRNSASQRFNEYVMHDIMAGSKYTDAMPIGTMDIVMNFKPQTLRDYYAKWYRPDLQGIVVVGDFDVNEMEKKIKKTFADIPAPKKDAAERIYYPVPDNKEPIVSIYKDKETQGSMVIMYFKNDITPRDKKNTREYMLNNLFNNFAYGMYHDHTREMVQKPNSPFSIAYIKINNDYFLANTKGCVQAIVGCHTEKGGIEKGYEAMLRELFRVREHGFTQTEFDRYRKDYLAGLDNILATKDKRYSGQFVQEYVRNFLDGEPIPTVEDEVAFWRAELPKLTVDDLNRHFKSLFKEDGSNIAITVDAPDQDSLQVPDAKTLLAIYYKVSKEKLAPYVDKVNDLPFLPVDPTPGKIVSETTYKDGFVRMELSNGMKVVIKQTDLKKDEILIQAVGRGGTATFSDEDARHADIINMMTQVEGWGNYSLDDIEKNFTGINTSMNCGIDKNLQSVAGTSVKKDIAHALMQAHACFLYPHKDADAVAALLKRLKDSTKDSKGKPNTIYGDSLNVTMYGNQLRLKKMEPEDYDSIDYDHMLDVYKSCFNDASNFTLTLVGDIDIDSLRPALCKYMASLPSTHQKHVAPVVCPILPGNRTCRFDHQAETPKSTFRVTFTAPEKQNLYTDMVASFLGQILSIKYTQTIREEAGAAYSPSAGATVDYYPQELARLVVSFTTDPKSVETATALVDKGLKDMAENGPDQDAFNKVREYMLKIAESNKTVNRYWQYAMTYEWNHGESYIHNYDESIKAVTPEKVQALAKKFLNGNRIECTMTSPEAK